MKDREGKKGRNGRNGRKGVGNRAGNPSEERKGKGYKTYLSAFLSGGSPPLTSHL